VNRFDRKGSEQVKHFFFHRLMSFNELDKFLDLDEEGSAREETTGISGLSIPDLIQAYDDEEIFLGRDPLSEFEREHVLPHLKYQSLEPVRTPSPRRKRGVSTDEPASIERSVRPTTTLPTIKRFNSAGSRRYRPPAGRGAFQSPLRTRAGIRSLERERGVLRSAFLFLQDDVYPATDKVGRALNKFREKFRKRCAPFCILRQGDYDVLVRIDPGNPSSSPRRVVWGEERFKVVQVPHEGEGHYGGAEKTRLKLVNRYWFPQLTNFVREFVKTCDVCQKERVGAAPQDYREIFPTPPTAPWVCTHVDLYGPFEELGPQKFRYIAVAVNSVTKFVEVRPLRGSKLYGVDLK
jgi:hypothetical protein